MILIDQLKEIYIDGELEPIDTTQWYPKVARKDYTVGLNVTGTRLDDPDQISTRTTPAARERNYTGYCNPEVDKLFDQQSHEADLEKRKKLVWEIERKLRRTARGRSSATAAAALLAAHVKGFTVMATASTTAGGWRTSGSTSRRS